VHPHSTGVSTYKACEEGCFLLCPQSPLVRLHHGEVLTLVTFPPGNNFAPTSASTHSHLLPFPNDVHRCRASALMMPPLCHLSTWEISPSNDTEDRDTIDGGKVEQCSRMAGRYRHKDGHILIRVGLGTLNRFLWVYYLLDSVVYAACLSISMRGARSGRQYRHRKWVTGG
jgi:hypothetical protein